jgi:hypothetical protein
MDRIELFEFLAFFAVIPPRGVCPQSEMFPDCHIHFIRLSHTCPRITVLTYMSAVCIEQSEAARSPFRVFAMCLDSAAVERARWLTRQLARKEAGRREVLPQVWRLDSAIAASSLQELIAQDAAEADVLVIAISSLNQREPALVDWFNSLTPWKQTCRRGRLLVGLFGDEDHPAGELAWLISELGGFARQTGMQFLWQWMAEGAMQDTEWLETGIEELIHANSSSPSVPAPEIPSCGMPASPA